MPISEKALNDLFSGDTEGDFAEFKYDVGIERFVGDVVNHRFHRMTIPTRQAWIWKRLQKEFPQDYKQVSLILAFSPAEWEEVGDPVREALFE